MAKLSIIVLQFNQSDRTLACLESLKALSETPSIPPRGKKSPLPFGEVGRGFDFSVIVVDNASEVQHLKNVEFWIESRKASSFQVRAFSFLVPRT